MGGRKLNKPGCVAAGVKSACRRWAEVAGRSGIRLGLGILLLAAAIVSAPGCARTPGTGGKRSGGVAGDAGPVRAVATTGMVADVVRAVGGEQVSVDQLLGSGIDPHTYKPTRDDMAAILRADIVFYNGLMLEGRMAEALERAGQHRPVVALAEAIPAELRLQGQDGSAHVDPHVWMDVSLWRTTAGSVANALARLDPAHAEEFHQRADAWQQDIEGLEQYCRERIASIPASSRVLVTSHDAFHYFGRAYGIEVQGVQGISTESEAGLQRINELVDLLVERRVPAVFCESSVSEKSIRAVVEGARSRGHTIRLAGPLFSDAMGEPGTWEGTWCGMIDHNVSMVARELGGSVPEGGWRTVRAPAASPTDAEPAGLPGS